MLSHFVNHGGVDPLIGTKYPIDIQSYLVDCNISAPIVEVSTLVTGQLGIWTDLVQRSQLAEQTSGWKETGVEQHVIIRFICR